MQCSCTVHCTDIKYVVLVSPVCNRHYCAPSEIFIFTGELLVERSGRGVE